MPDLTLRKVTHHQARDNYRVILKLDETEFEIGSIGPDLFKAACDMGLEGLISKRSDRPYRGGRSPYWIKVKNRKSPAMNRNGRR